MILCIYLRPLIAIFNLTGIETLLLWVLHAGKHSRAAEAYRKDGAFVVEVSSICNYLRTHTNTADVQYRVQSNQNDSTMSVLQKCANYIIIVQDIYMMNKFYLKNVCISVKKATCYVQNHISDKNRMTFTAKKKQKSKSPEELC